MSIDEVLIDIPHQLQALRAELQQLRAELQHQRQPDKLSYTLQEAAGTLGISYESVARLCRTGQLKYTQEKKRGTILINRTELQRWLSTNQTQPTNEPPIIPLNGAAKRAISKRSFS